MRVFCLSRGLGDLYTGQFSFRASVARLFRFGCLLSAQGLLWCSACPSVVRWFWVGGSVVLGRIGRGFATSSVAIVVRGFRGEKTTVS